MGNKIEEEKEMYEVANALNVLLMHYKATAEERILLNRYADLREKQAKEEILNKWFELKSKDTSNYQWMMDFQKYLEMI